MSRRALQTVCRGCAPAALLLSIILGTSREASGQEFRIYTRVCNELSAAGEAAASGESPVIARSLTLFRAGKVYDYIDAVGEVIIFEPAQDRFVILNTSRKLTTTVSLDELKQLLKIAQHATEKYVGELNEQGTAPSKRLAEALRFQMQPVFETNYDESRKALEMRSGVLSYRVRCAAPETPEAAATYLRYADWICRLNYILHPQSLFPESRLALNASLRERELIPVEVELEAEIAHRVHLRAEHQVHWQLDNKDRSLIHQWETQLKDKGTTPVSFREYQRALLVSAVQRR